MSDAKICDRCGQTIKLFEDDIPYENDAWRYEITKDCHPYDTKIKIDLCSDCKKDLKRWLGKASNKEREKPNQTLKTCKNCGYPYKLAGRCYSCNNYSQWIPIEADRET